MFCCILYPCTDISPISGLQHCMEFQSLSPPLHWSRRYQLISILKPIPRFLNYQGLKNLPLALLVSVRSYLPLDLPKMLITYLTAVREGMLSKLGLGVVHHPVKQMVLITKIIHMVEEMKTKRVLVVLCLWMPLWLERQMSHRPQVIIILRSRTHVMTVNQGCPQAWATPK